MADPVISPAYRQIVEWYQHWQTMEMAKPIPLLGVSQDDLGPKTTDAQTQLDIYA